MLQSLFRRLGFIRSRKDNLIEISSAEEKRSHAGSADWFSYRGNALSLSSATAAWNAAHELQHFYGHVSTPYGLFLDHLHTRQRALLLGFLRAACQSGVAVPVPLYRFARAIRRRDASALKADPTGILARLVDQYVVPWTRLQHLVDVLEGRNVASVSKCTSQAAVHHLLEIEECLTNDDDFSSINWTPTDLSSTTNRSRTAWALDDLGACDRGQLVVGKKAMSFPIGGHHIFETAATVGSPDTVDALRTIAATPEYGYLTLVNLILPATSDIVDGRLVDRPEDAHWSYEEYDLARRAVAAVCYLSLFTPIGPLYSELRNRGGSVRRAFYQTWPNLHPGWRIRQTWRFIESHKHLLKQLETGYMPFMDAVSAELNWIGPTEFLEHALASTENPWNSSRHIAAARLLSTKPTVFVEGYLIEGGSDIEEQVEFLALHGPSMSIGSDSWTYQPGSYDALGDMFWDVYAFRLLHRTARSLSSCLPSNVTTDPVLRIDVQTSWIEAAVSKLVLRCAPTYSAYETFE